MVLAIFGQGDPVPSYLIRTDDGINVLIDTGFSPEMIAASQQSDTTEQYIRDAVPITDHLATLGLAPTDIHYLIATHFDPDHAGAHDAFPNAEIVVQRAHTKWRREERTAVTR
jgi:N-acyl homoserine lactone hydrolase